MHDPKRLDTIRSVWPRCGRLPLVGMKTQQSFEEAVHRQSGAPGTYLGPWISEEYNSPTLLAWWKLYDYIGLAEQGLMQNESSTSDRYMTVWPPSQRRYIYASKLSPEMDKL